MADWDWRDEFEERTEGNSVILTVVKDGDKYHYLAKNDSGEVICNRSKLIPKYKPKPKTYRPWKVDEVPVGSVIKIKSNDFRAVITSASGSNTIRVADIIYSLKDVFESYTMLDGTPCGAIES